MEWFLSIFLKVIIEKFTDMSILVFKNALLKRGIRVKAEKALDAIENGDGELNDGNLDGWLRELNDENN